MRFSIRELVAYAFSLTTLAVTITVWATDKFETKENVAILAQKVDDHRTLMIKIAEDVAYIRGKLESKEIK